MLHADVEVLRDQVNELDRQMRKVHDLLEGLARDRSAEVGAQ